MSEQPTLKLAGVNLKATPAKGLSDVCEGCYLEKGDGCLTTLPLENYCWRDGVDYIFVEVEDAYSNNEQGRA